MVNRCDRGFGREDQEAEEMTELKPCPFCGGERINTTVDYFNKKFAIWCEDCHANMDLSFADAKIGDGSFISFSEAANIMVALLESWNRRTHENR